MVMPKWNWEKFKLGDWVLTKPQYAVGRDEEQRDERELTNIRKIEPNDYAKNKIPPTEVQGCTVKIKCHFVLCPDYIQYREASNSFGKYKKLLLMNIGQGFVSSNNRELFNQLQPDCVYIGVFAFQAKDNGACNFGHRSSVRDHTNHVLERDAMWQLTKIMGTAKPEKRKEMSDWLDALKKDAEEFYHGLEQQGALKRRSKSAPRPLLEVSNANSSATSGRSRRSPSSRRTNTSFKSQSQPFEGSSSQNLTLASNPDSSDYVVEFTSEEEFLKHRSSTIVQMTVKDGSGKVARRWYDLETRQSSPDNDILYFKFGKRYKVIENPRAASRATPVPPTPRSRTISESSVRTNTLGQPMATSTPRPSPPPSPIPSPATPLRFFEHSQYETIQSDEREEADEGNGEDFLNQTSNTTLLQQDNNANPVYRTPFMRR